jgi:hypothetical protein
LKNEKGEAMDNTAERVTTSVKFLDPQRLINVSLSASMFFAFILGGMYGAYYAFKVAGLVAIADNIMTGLMIILGVGFITASTFIGALAATAAVFIAFYLATWGIHHLVSLAFAGWDKMKDIWNNNPMVLHPRVSVKEDTHVQREAG